MSTVGNSSIDIMSMLVRLFEDQLIIVKQKIEKDDIAMVDLMVKKGEVYFFNYNEQLDVLCATKRRHEVEKSRIETAKNFAEKGIFGKCEKCGKEAITLEKIKTMVNIPEDCSLLSLFLRCIPCRSRHQ